jgi:hypothetical protein
MTMNFRSIKTALQALLDADGVINGYRVIGFQRQISNIEEVLDNNKLVQVFYSAGNFDKGNGSRQGPVDHEMTFLVELYLSKASEGDKTALDSATTDVQRAAAIATFKEAAELADEEMDEFIDYVWNTLMDARNQNLGLPEPPEPGATIRVANTWAGNIQKDNVVGDGEYSGLTARITFKCNVIEDLNGDTGLPFDEGLDQEYSVNTDPDVEPVDEATPIAGQYLVDEP